MNRFCRPNGPLQFHSIDAPELTDPLWLIASTIAQIRFLGLSNSTGFTSVEWLICEFPAEMLCRFLGLLNAVVPTIGVCRLHGHLSRAWAC